MKEPNPSTHSEADEAPPPPPFTIPQGVPSQMVEPELGTRIGPYELVKLLGRGSLGPVYLGRDTRLGRSVAVKLLRCPTAEVAQRFLLETRSMSGWRHENIALTSSAEAAWDGCPVVVTEFLVGRPLTHLVRDGKPLSAPRAVELVVPVVRALAFAHSQGIVHRNLKAANVFLCDSGAVKVLDFGVARLFQNDEHAPALVARPRPRLAEPGSVDELTQRAALAGTLAVLAPEQWVGGPGIDHRADLWAVGVMLFHLLTGKHPLDGHRLETVAELDTPMPKLAQHPEGVPVELAALVDACLMKRKEHRWADAVSLLRALEHFLPAPVKPSGAVQRPYVGLAPFEEGDASLFFGRSAQIAAAVHRLRDRPAIAVIGPPGVGKSSFVRAGLVPALKRSGEVWEALTLRPGRSPLTALASLLGPLLASPASGVEPVTENFKLARRIAAEPGFAGVVLRARARKDSSHLLCVVDQLEELFTVVTDAAERHAFIAAVLGLADDPAAPVRLVITMRSDFLDRCSEDARLMARLSEGLFFLGPLGPETMREAISGPAELAGYQFESPAIVDELVAQLQGKRGALSLLQFSLARLWERRDTSTQRLTQEAYREAGGAAGPLPKHADDALAELDPELLVLARAILLRLVTAERTRALVTLAEMKELHPDHDELTEVIDELVKAGLVSVQPHGRAPTMELAHESLTYTWPTLERWLEERAEDLAFVERLKPAASAWDHRVRSGATLWRGTDAEQAQRFAARYRGPLSDAQREFLLEVVATKRRALNRRRASVVGTIAFLAMLAAGSLGGLVFLKQSRDDAVAHAQAAQAAESLARHAMEVTEHRALEAAQAAAAKALVAERTRQELERALSEYEDLGKRARQTSPVVRLPPPPLVPAEAEKAPLEKSPAQEKARAGEESSGSVIETLK